MFSDASWLAATGRLLIAFSFVVAGLSNLTRAAIKQHIERLAGFIGVICLIVFTVAATAIYHRFWSKQDPMQRTISRITLVGNTAIVGGVLLQNVR